MGKYRASESFDINNPAVERRIMACVRGGMLKKTICERFKIDSDRLNAKIAEVKMREGK